MSGRVRVKICGITNRADAEMAIVCGADALGFNLFAGSSRCIDFEENADWIAALSPFVTKVAVLVNVPFAEACRIAAHPAIGLVQFHGDEDPAFCAAFAKTGHPFIKALRVRTAMDLAQAAHFSTPLVLLDGLVPGAYGGTGARLDVALASDLVSREPGLNIILAGGLSPTNVDEATRVVRPFAVDVASGVESAPGRKDSALVAAFINAALGRC
jgi:phosphoribosylanthranilate isomerase